MRVFISYSHRDDWALERLHTHLAMLRREGSIVEWYDREILAGGDLDQEISSKLDTSELFLALASPDFLASDYCYEREMTRALERHDAGQARVVPIIVEPCDWKSSPLQRLKALPRDGKPITEWTNQNNAFMDIVTELRRVVSEENVEDTRTEPPAKGTKVRENRRYRLKRDFDEIDRGDFRAKAFDAFSGYFEAAIAEIDSIEGIRARFSPLGPRSFGCTVINQARESGSAHITVHAGTENIGLGDIYYSFKENASENTANGIFSIESDEYDLFLRPDLFGYSTQEERFSPQDAAEFLWTKFVEQAGISYD